MGDEENGRDIPWGHLEPLYRQLQGETNGAPARAELSPSSSSMAPGASFISRLMRFLYRWLWQVDAEVKESRDRIKKLELDNEILELENRALIQQNNKLRSWIELDSAAAVARNKAAGLGQDDKEKKR